MIIVDEFEDVYQIVEESSHETAFNKEECRGLWDLLRGMSLIKDAAIVEIGVEYGRSTTVIAEAKKRYNKEWRFSAIDSWKQKNGKEACEHVLKQMQKHSWDFNLWTSDSLVAAANYNLPIDLLHIDGQHTYEAVKADCEAWMPKVKKGGFVCFDDFGHPGFDGVKKAAMEYVHKNPNYTFWGLYGDKLGVYLKMRAGA